MSCGHLLRSRLVDCGKGEECKGKRWQPAFIDDSCVACHRPLNYRLNRALHEAEHAVLISDFVRARAAGDTEGMRRLQRAMIENAQVTRQRNFAVSLTREEMMGVRWPRTDDSLCRHDGVGSTAK
ncbi:hypothetical protein CCHL11_01071 [Colletotrichum chlorophyti]|uniref:Uncharacterized protein n=1 Tax=Colletotrichum chlorophyti TaxID=708187 RepID=A0A1Q8S7A4_9PEZI|nr:hypothetical protein CCHL11_01071 [Colletotrichum chlorophyti]